MADTPCCCVSVAILRGGSLLDTASGGIREQIGSLTREKGQPLTRVRVGAAQTCALRWQRRPLSPRTRKPLLGSRSRLPLRSPYDTSTALPSPATLVWYWRTQHNPERVTLDQVQSHTAGAHTFMVIILAPIQP